LVSDFWPFAAPSTPEQWTVVDVSRRVMYGQKQ
jgi:hypothetical protein